MITQIVKLKQSGDINTFNNMYKDDRNHNDVWFGNDILFDRYNTYKLVEHVTHDTVVEHIVQIDKETQAKQVQPFVTKFITRGNTKVYVHMYTHGLVEATEHVNEGLYCPFPVGYTVYNRITKQMHIHEPNLEKVLKDWKSKNPDIADISPAYTFSKENISTDISISDIYLDPLYRQHDLRKFSYINHQNPLNNDDLDVLSQELGGQLLDIYHSVQNGSEGVLTLSTALVNIFAPWKRYLYNGTALIPQLTANRNFVFEGLNLNELQRYSSTYTIGQMPKFTIPTIKEVKNVNAIFEDLPVETANREFLALVDYINSINLTDFDISYKLAYIRDGILSPIINFSLNRYFPHDPINQYSKNIEDGFEDTTLHGRLYILEGLEDKLGNWLLTSLNEDITEIYTSVRLIKTYNEDLFIYFDNERTGAKTDAIHIDLIAFTLSSLNMCSKEE